MWAARYADRPRLLQACHGPVFLLRAFSIWVGAIGLRRLYGGTVGVQAQALYRADVGHSIAPHMRLFRAG